jgi:hypothetical protein
MPGHYGPTTLSLVSSAAMPDYVISTLKVCRLTSVSINSTPP